ncbi:hypothetical protein AVEN_47520-1 [Araneus ventricosus]|uniref:Uncharacterized protein n=1 Tax=Araneus ventricosus TaxID=182803 RepID=A0A4Y2FH45_ARAVE|nr:hypothetical protein AVEN_47520-1 [Araneus ventricosus]
MTRTTPELAPPSPNFHATPTGGRLTTTYDLACNRPHTRRIFSGIGSRTLSLSLSEGIPDNSMGLKNFTGYDFTCYCPLPYLQIDIL